VVCGYTYSFAYKTDGTMYSWGSNYYSGQPAGQLGAPSTLLGKVSSPIQVGSLTNWKQAAYGFYSGGAIKTDGTLWTWGRNLEGQLGNNNATVNYSSPIQVGSLTNWKQIAFGYYFTAAIKTDGTLWAWGYNGYGELGNGTRTNYSSPIQVGLLTNWSKISCGFGHTAAVKTDGTLWTCGYNRYGQLGNGTGVYYSSPIQVGSLTIWKQVSQGGNYCFAIQAPELELAQYVPGPPTGVS
jgi:alpha-tubulin suppressor-like RCC1 family protein